VERLRPTDPEQIGPWQIVNRLGAGGMGIVYTGTNGTHAAAIKVVREHLLEDPTSRIRLAREVASLKKIRSFFVSEIVGSDVEGSPAWIATSYVDGPSLKVLIDSQGALSERAWRDLAAGLLQALSAVHKVNIIHRDVKPANILMSTSGPRLIDFGISFSNESTSLTRTGLVAGTPAWLSPEQFENRIITSAVDNFALGSVLYFAATGIAPWGSDDSSVAQVMRQILTTEPKLEKLSDLQKEIIGGLLEKEPKKRLTAEAAMKVLKVAPEIISTSYARPLIDSKKTPSVKKKVVLALSIVVMLIAGAFFAVGKSNNQVAIKTATSTSSTTSTPTAGSATTATPWRGEFSGDAAPQNGFGSTYKLYVCDQNVSGSSLKVSAIGSSSSVLPAPSVVANDPICGKGFDTIYVSGFVPGHAMHYRLTGKTRSGISFRYSFSIQSA